ncbi:MULTISPECIES: hypothetical protein [unclassified Xanthobacter]|uniref:hypothetical protein n=1 Tax=unclassified Xanthobacter TaxID=2623496 RepID=UPI001EDD57A2|nr:MULTISPECIES: hypothetical protein [unclassified Xanthobacter]
MTGFAWQVAPAPAQGRGDAFVVQGDRAKVAETERLSDALAARLGWRDVVVHHAGIPQNGSHAEWERPAVAHLSALNLAAALPVVRRAARPVVDGAWAPASLDA